MADRSRSRSKNAQKALNKLKKHAHSEHSAQQAKITPPKYEYLITRPRITQRLDDVLHLAVCWIAGPAGTGKTLAVADYLNCHTRPAFWYRVDEGDLDPAAFFDDFSKLIRLPDGRALPRYGAEYAAHINILARRYFRAFYSLIPANSIIVFDDLHLVNDQIFQKIVSLALLEMPQTMSCFCLSRHLPFSCLTDLQFKSQLITVDHNELSFSREETTQLFSRYGLNDALAERAYQLTQGWIAGLVLIAERYYQQDIVAIDEQVFQENSRSLLFYYLADKVFRVLPDTQQQLLVRTSVLPEVNARLANELLEINEADEILEKIYRRQLFISRRTDKVIFYRYHDLLRDFLIDELSKQTTSEELRVFRRKTAVLLDRHHYVSEAIELGLEIQDWQLALCLLAKHAEAMLQAGRYESFIAWSKEVPVSYLLKDEAICYWLGVANMIYDDNEAEKWFLQAYALYSRKQDKLGQMRTIAKAILARYYGWRSLEGVEYWVEKALQVQLALIKFDTAEDEVLSLSGLLRALTLADQNVQNTKCAREISDRLLPLLYLKGKTIDVNVLTLSADTLMYFYGRYVGVDLFDQAAAVAQPVLTDARLKPWVLATWETTYGAFNALRFPLTGLNQRYLIGAEALRHAVVICEQEKLSNIEFGALCNLFHYYRSRSEYTELRKLMKRIERLANLHEQTQAKKLKEIQIAYYLATRQFEKAIQISDELIAQFDKKQPLDQLISYRLTRFYRFLTTESYTAAIAYLSPSLDEYKGVLRDYVQTCIELTQVLMLKRTENQAYVDLLRCALQKASRNMWINLLSYVPNIVAELMSTALRHEIEPNFCRSIIEYRNLMPPTPTTIHWPWPVKLFAFGRLEIEVDEKNTVLGRKYHTTQGLLSLLVAFGPNGVNNHFLFESLWPESSLAAAKTSLKVAIHRTRKLLIYDQAILFEDDRVKLNPAVVWVDVWIFDQQAHHVINKLHTTHYHNQTFAAAEDLVALYKAVLFGAQRDETWYVPLQEKLKSRFIELLVALGEQYELQRRWEDAVKAYSSGLQQDNLVEEFYRGLIRSKLALREPNAALHVFRQCREVLSIVLGTAPTLATMQLINDVRKAGERTELIRSSL